MNNAQSAIRNVQAEIIAIMTDVGVSTDPTKSDQLLAALKKTFALNTSPALQGNPTATTQPKADNSTKLATTAHVKLVAADYAPLANPALTGKPTAPTATQTSNDTQLATTAFVKAAIAALVDSSPGALDTLNELAAALGDDSNFAATMNAALAAKAPLASPALTGTPTAPTAAAGTNTTQIATTAFVTALAALKANLASPAFTGTPTTPTAATATSNTQIATTAFMKAAIASLVDSAPEALDTLNELAAAIGDDPNFSVTMTNLIAGKAPLVSPQFTGTPIAPTAAAATNNTQIATTAHVKAAIAAGTSAAAGKLATARKINGVLFDGTGDINLTPQNPGLVEIVETGSGTGYYWRKFADGKIEIFGRFATTYGARPDIVFPVAFTSTPFIVIKENGSIDSAFVIRMQNLSKTGFSIFWNTFGGGGSGASIDVCYHAMG